MDSSFLHHLLEISRRMAETRELDPLLKYAMQIALELLRAENGYLVLHHANGALEFRVKLNESGEELQHPEDQISLTIYEKVIRTGKPFLSIDAQYDPAVAKAQSVQALQLRSVICAPLITHNGILGAIYLENRSKAAVFSEHDLEPLTFFASQAAVAIENAILNDELEARVKARTAELETAMSQLEQSWLEALEFNRLRTLVLSSVAHDIRSPIALAYSALATIQQGIFGSLHDAQNDWIGRAMESLNHALHLTNDIFDLTKSEIGQLHLNFETLALEPYLQRVFEVAQTLPNPHQLSLILDLASPLPPVSLDPMRIQQVILNLLSNAYKYTQQGQVLLYALADFDAEHVLIGVRDTGQGIPAHQIEAIFERFVQGEQDEQTRRIGTGLGLAICRELVKKHGGRIWVESEVGKGSDFKFTVPLR